MTFYVGMTRVHDILAPLARMRGRLVLTVLLMAASVQVSAQGPGTISGAVRLRPNDAMKITVWGDEKLSGEFDVAEDGTLRHPVYSQVRVTGISVDSVRVLLKGVLQTFQREPLFVVEPLIRVSVSGQVRSPNSYLIRPDASIADVLLKAGGGTERAKLSRIEIGRAGSYVYADITQPSTPDAERLQSGDRVIVVPKRPPFTTYIGTVASLLAASASIFLVARR